MQDAICLKSSNVVDVGWFAAAPQRQVDKHPMRGSSAHVAGIRGRGGGLHRPVARRQAPDLSILSREQESPRGWRGPMMRSSLEGALEQVRPYLLSDGVWFLQSTC
jgi:hypothetical protein